MFRKADLSLNVVIVAVIALIVLIVVVAIFAGKMDLFQKGVRSCASQGGHCSCWSGFGADGSPNWLDKMCTVGKMECPDNWAPVEGTDCNVDGVKDNDLCCIKVL